MMWTDSPGSGYSPVTGISEHGDESSGSTKAENFLSDS
jgi:hypothetical protein